VPPSIRYQRRRVAKVERRDAEHQEQIRQADLRHARTGNWGSSERDAREALERNKTDLFYN
jgi:hypothetical protein